MDDKERFGEALRALREKRGISRMELASRLGVHLNTIAAWECGKKSPRMAHARELAVILEHLT